MGIYEPTLIRLNLINDILNDIVLEYKYSAKRKNIVISFSSKLEAPVILGGRYSVTQIFANLVDNAIKYTNSGKINISLNNHGDKIKVMIEDTGVGISKEYLPILFDSFTQEDRGYTRKFEGNGLGLALVKKYCELNNASISVKSKKGDGTTFSVEFDNINPN
jgi:signal transduction histidine kinase